MSQSEDCRHIAEKETNLDRKTLKKILDNSFDEIFVTDGKGVTIYSNRASEKNYGVSPLRLINQKPGQMAAEGLCYPPITPTILRDKNRVTVEQHTVTGRSLVTTAEPVFDKNGELELVIMNVRDMLEIGEIKHDFEETVKFAAKYKQEIEALRKNEFLFNDLVARSKQMEDLLDLVHKVAPVDSNILILGESGTGKGVMANHIHKESKRKDGPFVTINCAAIPEQLLESELFGYAAGTFTGGDRNGKKGLIDLAQGGTLFLDEIAEIPLALQAKLLHVIQEFKYSPVGGRESKLMDCRIIAATNCNLADMVNEGRFRSDLYYRLKVIEMEIPPLRERKEDIVPLVYLFLNRYDKKYKSSHQLSQDCLDAICHYPWPGNIRELEHMIERLVVTSQDGTMEVNQMPKNIRTVIEEQDNVCWATDITLAQAIEQVEKELILRAYKLHKSSYKVATALDISQTSAWRMINKHIPQEERAK